MDNGGTASGIGSSSNDAGNLILNGGALRYEGTTGNSTDRRFTLTSNGGALDASGAAAVSFTNTSSVAISGSGARTLILTGDNLNNNTLAASIGDGSGGATSLVKSGTGTWILTGTSAYTGGTTISDGMLKLSGGNNRLATTGAITISGGVLDLDANSQTTTGTVRFQGGTVQNGTLITSADFDGQAGTVSLVLGGNIGLNKTTTGTLTLIAGNTYSGGTTVSGGTLEARILNNGGMASCIGSSPNGASNLIIDGGTLKYIGAGNSTDRQFTLTQNGGA